MKFINTTVMLMALLSVAACSTAKTTFESKSSNNKNKKQHERFYGRFER